jgi:hypothetical protein
MHCHLTGVVLDHQCSTCLPNQGRLAPPLFFQGTPPAAPFARQGWPATPPVGGKMDMKHGINEAFASSLSTKTSLQQSLSLHWLHHEIGSIPVTPGDQMTSCLPGKKKVLKKHRHFFSRHLHPFCSCIHFCHTDDLSRFQEAHPCFKSGHQFVCPQRSSTRAPLSNN